MRVAHFTRYAPRRSGLYETSREMVEAEMKLGLDAFLVDTAYVNNEGPKMTTRIFDRGVEVIPVEDAADADIYVLHSVIPDELRYKKPTIVILHGAPEYVFYSEVMEHEKGDRGFSTLLGYDKEKNIPAFVTLWKRHVPYWQSIFGENKVMYVPSGVNTGTFTPDGETEKFSKPGTPNIGYADSWRPTFFQGPFRVIQGVREYWKKNPNAKLQLFGTPSGQKRDIVWDRYILAVRRQGDFLGDLFEIRADMDRAFRSLDVLVTTNIDESRIVKEALCCGTLVVAPSGADFTDWTCDLAVAEDLADCIEEALVGDKRSRVDRAVSAREKYDSMKMAEGLKGIFEKFKA